MHIVTHKDQSYHAYESVMSHTTDEAEKMEQMAKKAVGANLFNSNMFKALKPFPEPAIDPP